MRQEIQNILWKIEDLIYKIEDSDYVDKKLIQESEDYYYKNKKRLTMKELALIFPEAKKILEEKKLETLKELKEAQEKVHSSVATYKKDNSAKPICLAVIDIIFENEIYPLQKRLDRIEYDYDALVNEKKAGISAEDLKESIDLRDVIEGYGIKIKKSGKESQVSCPFHKDKIPSLSVSRTLWHCFVGCGSGDVFDFVMKIEDCDFREAVEKLTK